MYDLKKPDLFIAILINLQIIKIHFTHLLLFGEAGQECTPGSDRLVIVDIDNQRTCLKSDTREFTSRSNIITIRFLTNGAGDAPGFRLQYKTGICITKCIVILLVTILFLYNLTCYYANITHKIANSLTYSTTSVYLIIMFAYMYLLEIYYNNEMRHRLATPPPHICSLHICSLCAFMYCDWINWTRTFYFPQSSQK